MYQPRLLDEKCSVHSDWRHCLGTIRSMEASYIDVPGPDAHWWTEINEFALTYNAYDRGSGFDTVAGSDQRVRQAWDLDATLPDDLDACRSTLFFEQRRFRHLDAQPTGDDDRFVRALLRQIRELSGGQVPGPPDPLP